MDLSTVVSGSLQGNSTAFQVLFELFYEDVYRSAYMVTRNREQAEDATQEAFLKAFQRLDSLEEPKKFGAWVRAIVVRSAIDILRRNKGLVPAEEPEDFPQGMPVHLATLLLPEEELERAELRTKVREAIRALAPAQQQVVTLKYYHGLKDLEIAELLQVSVGTVKSRAHRALQTLERRLAPYYRYGSATTGKLPG
ncbi:MAG: RNA polymerase sigma factor [Firmicutes bacterium]|nr:RNA polymerase sigma factor [Bacillota bacterium]